ncbi:hypothetical protein OG936_33610 [Streptomyces sp. NBC_00846]|nr:hypothetical protein OG936_33610 [Streptomyces sp. NBC_00846]
MRLRTRHEGRCATALYPEPCRWEEIGREDDAYCQEPDDMADREDGIA